MAWTVTAEPDEYVEAVDWFRSRVPYTWDQYGALEDDARKKAFWIAGQVEIETVQTIFDELDRSIAKGLPLEDFKAAVREKLGAKVGPEGYHLDLVFRNWTQQAFNTARWYQLTDPEATLLRSYLLYDSVLDGSTTPHCRAWDGVIRQYDDPCWLTHHPQCHHGCRACLRSLRESEARERGITAVLPGETPSEGFGLAPPLREGLPPLKRERFDPDLLAVFDERAAQSELERQEAERKAREARQRQDPKFWYDTEYGPVYGADAGRAVAWGRAMEERGKTLSMAEAERQHVDLTETLGVTLGKHRVPLFQRIREATAAGTIPEAETLGEAIEALAAVPELEQAATEARALAALAGHRLGIDAAGDAVKLSAPRFAPGTPDDIRKIALDALVKLRKFWSQLGDRSVVLPDKRLGYVVRWSEERAYFDEAQRTVHTRWAKRGGTVVDTGASTVVHEMAHGIEAHDDRARRAAHEFLERRTQGESARPLSELTGNPGYPAHEVSKRDRFLNPYMGKEYVSASGHRYATEVSSMAIEHLHRDAADLLERDPETFWFAVGQLAGDAAR